MTILKITIKLLALEVCFNYFFIKGKLQTRTEYTVQKNNIEGHIESIGKCTV